MGCNSGKTHPAWHPASDPAPHPAPHPAPRPAMRGRTSMFNNIQLIQEDPPKLGVVRLDYDYPWAPGDVDCPESYNYPVVYRAVPGLTFEMCQSGEMTHKVETKFKEAIDFLVYEEKCKVITGDCGFMMYFQPLARHYAGFGGVNQAAAVALSSLCQLPSISSCFAPGAKIAIFTANSETLTPMRELINTETGVHVENTDKYVIVGCQDVPGFEAVAEGGKVDTAKVEPGIVAKAKQVLEDHPNEIMAFLFECTELPPYSDAVRFATGLPVYDAITNADFIMMGLMDNKRFGMRWQTEFDGVQAPNRLSAHLSEEERRSLVSRITEEERLSLLQRRSLRSSLVSRMTEDERCSLVSGIQNEEIKGGISGEFSDEISEEIPEEI